MDRKSRTLRYTGFPSGNDELIMIDKITHFSKSRDGNTTFIHLANGIVLPTTDSINTIEARIK